MTLGASKATGEIVEKPCGRRRCSACGPHLARCHVAHFTEVFRALPALFAATFTLDPKSVTTADPKVYARTLTEQVWSPFVDRLRRTCKASGVRPVYLAAVERHGNGWPHIHAVVSCSFPDAEEVMAETWFRAGGGAVLSVERLYGGERGCARWIGYVLKSRFGPGATGAGRLLTSHGIGYNTEHAVTKRKSFIDNPIRDVIYAPPERYAPPSDRAVEKALPIGAVPIELSRRTKRCVIRRAGTQYGTQITVREGGGRDYVVVRIEWDASRNQAMYDPVSEHGTNAEALEAIRRLCGDDDF